MKHTLIALVLACIALFSNVMATSAASGTKYDIEFDLDIATGHLSATQRTTLTNDSIQPLTTIAFSVVPAYFKSFTLRTATIGGQPVPSTLDGSILMLKPSTSIAPRASTAVELSYTINLPRPGTNRFGFASGVLALGNWYPVLFPLRDGIWTTNQYTPIGDAFVTETADYLVTVRPSARVTIAHTGQIVSTDGLSVKLAANGVRDFALAISTRYEMASAVVDGVKISTYFLPEHRSQATEYHRTGTEIFAWLVAKLGPYDAPGLSIVETVSNDPNEVGQEFPGIIFISSGATAPGGEMGSYLSYLIAHEIAHQWFYGIVGNDQVREPWLDEAFATYLPERFFTDRYPAIAATRWATFRSRLASEATRIGSPAIDSGVFDYRDEGLYFAVVYRRGAAFLDEVRIKMGDEVFWRFIRDFVNRNRGGIARGTDFLTLAQAATPADLAPLMRSYFRRTQVRGADWDIPNGHFYTQTNGGQAGTGYRVTNDGNARFWDEFQRLGGIDGLGYPASRRFSWEGFTVQVFQKAILQWRPEVGRAYFVNVLDRISAAGKDDWLLTQRMTPLPFDPAPDTGLAWSAVVARHEAILERDGAIRARYFAEGDPVSRYGLPMSAEDLPAAYVVRAQRVVFQRWKTDQPWAKAGQVTIANGGDLAKEAGILPSDALAPEAPP